MTLTYFLGHRGHIRCINHCIYVISLKFLCTECLFFYHRFVLGDLSNTHVYSDLDPVSRSPTGPEQCYQHIKPQQGYGGKQCSLLITPLEFNGVISIGIQWGYEGNYVVHRFVLRVFLMTHVNSDLDPFSGSPIGPEQCYQHIKPQWGFYGKQCKTSSEHNGAAQTINMSHHKNTIRAS